tara:strand:- start:1209 stop:1796 length:588 start_codon:yes stop_codon:yes gene_type:complete
MRIFTIKIRPLHIGFVKERSVFRPSPVKKRMGYKYGAEWVSPWGKAHGVMDSTEACNEELERLIQEPMRRCMIALDKAKARFAEKYAGMTYEAEITGYEAPYPQIPSATRPIMSRRWKAWQRETWLLDQAKQQAEGKIKNVIRAYQDREFATAKGCFHDLNQWYLSLCSVARPDEHIVKFQYHDKFIQSFRTKKK